MNINLTLIAEAIVFVAFIWFCKRYVWSPIITALHDRKSQIADGLAAAERGQQEHELAEKRAVETLKEAKEQASEIIAKAEKRASDIVDESKNDARAEGERLLAAAKAEIEQEMQRAKETLRADLSAIVVSGAEKILEREVDAAAHDDMIKKLAAQI